MNINKYGNQPYWSHRFRLLTRSATVDGSVSDVSVAVGPDPTPSEDAPGAADAETVCLLINGFIPYPTCHYYYKFGKLLFVGLTFYEILHVLIVFIT